MIDAWLDLMDKAREEDYYDKKYWAFLNGYLGLKMAQLMENELSIVETSVKLFIKKLKSEYPAANLEERMSVGKFLDELKDEPSVLVGYTNFLAEEFLKENDKSDQAEVNDYPDQAKVNEVDLNSKSALKKNIEKMKDDFSKVDHYDFVMQAFWNASQTQIGNLLMECQVDITNAIAESQKRDEEREHRRRENEEARRLEEEQQERRGNIKIDEVNEVVKEEDERMLLVEGNKKMNELRSSGSSVHEDLEFVQEKAKGELRGDYDYIRIQDVVSSQNHSQDTRNTVFADGVSANDIR